MFEIVVFTLMTTLLVLATGAALFMGIFKGHREKVSLPGKIISGLVSFTLSAAFWYGAYGYHYLGW